MNLKSGIYKISFKNTKWFYIGCAINLVDRKNLHLHHLRNCRHKNPKMQNCFDKYGEDSFIFEIVEYCENTNLLMREQYWIDTLKPNLNVRKIADSNIGIKWSSQTKNKMSKAKIGKKMIDMIGKTYGKLTVISRDLVNSKHWQPKYYCICECEKTISTLGASLRSGHTKSCGCLQKEHANKNCKLMTANKLTRPLQSWQYIEVPK